MEIHKKDDEMLPSHIFVAQCLQGDQPSIILKIFETNSILYVKERTTGKVSIFQEVFASINKISTKCSFWQENWALGCHAMKFGHFDDIS